MIGVCGHLQRIWSVVFHHRDIQHWWWIPTCVALSPVLPTLALFRVAQCSLVRVVPLSLGRASLHGHQSLSFHFFNLFTGDSVCPSSPLLWSFYKLLIVILLPGDRKVSVSTSAGVNDSINCQGWWESSRCFYSKETVMVANGHTACTSIFLWNHLAKLQLGLYWFPNDQEPLWLFGVHNYVEYETSWEVMLMRKKLVLVGLACCCSFEPVMSPNQRLMQALILGGAWSQWAYSCKWGHQGPIPHNALVRIGQSNLVSLCVC